MAVQQSGEPGGIGKRSLSLWSAVQRNEQALDQPGSGNCLFTSEGRPDTNVRSGEFLIGCFLTVCCCFFFVALLTLEARSRHPTSRLRLFGHFFGNPVCLCLDSAVTVPFKQSTRLCSGVFSRLALDLVHDHRGERIGGRCIGGAVRQLYVGGIHDVCLLQYRKNYTAYQLFGTHLPYEERLTTASRKWFREITL
jgi:hypothetical protein